MPTTKVKIKGEMVIINDWTQDTIILDLTNALGELYHFEIEPNADANSVPTRPANDDTVLHLWMPIASPTPLPEK
jgi:hypothetical protein